MGDKDANDCVQKGMCMNMKYFAGVLSAGMMAVSALAGGLPVSNLGFEENQVGWEVWGDGDIRQEYHAIKPHGGANFLRLWSRSGWYQDFPVQANQTLKYSAYVASAKGDGLWGDAFGEVKIEWRDKSAGDVEVAGKSASTKFDLVGKQDLTIKPDEWTKVSLTGLKAPPKATHGRLMLTIWTEGADKGGGCALFDDLEAGVLP